MKTKSEPPYVGSYAYLVRLHAARGATNDENGGGRQGVAERRLTAGYVATDWPAGKATTEATTVMNFGPHKPARMPALRPLPRPEAKAIFWSGAYGVSCGCGGRPEARKWAVISAGFKARP